MSEFAELFLKGDELERTVAVETAHLRSDKDKTRRQSVWMQEIIAYDRRQCRRIDNSFPVCSRNSLQTYPTLP